MVEGHSIEHGDEGCAPLVPLRRSDGGDVSCSVKTGELRQLWVLIDSTGDNAGASP
jgi:hypothetical protein